MTPMMHNPLFLSVLLIGMVVVIMALYFGVRILAGRVEAGDRRAAASEAGSSARSRPTDPTG